MYKSKMKLSLDKEIVRKIKEKTKKGKKLMKKLKKKKGLTRLFICLVSAEWPLKIQTHN